MSDINVDEFVRTIRSISPEMDMKGMFQRKSMVKALGCIQQLQSENEKYKDALATKFNAEMCEALKPIRDKIDKLKAENEQLKQFARIVIEIECWSIFPQDGGDLQELAEKLGLIVPCIVTEEDLKDLDEDFDYGVGDTFYKLSDMLKGIEP